MVKLTGPYVGFYNHETTFVTNNRFIIYNIYRIYKLLCLWVYNLKPPTSFLVLLVGLNEKERHSGNEAVVICIDLLLNDY